jgi:hypothetical protein
MGIDDHTFNHEKKGACSCAVAQEIEETGLFSTLHCRFTVDGTQCVNDSCPYSHAELKRLFSSQVYRVILTLNGLQCLTPNPHRTA